MMQLTNDTTVLFGNYVLICIIDIILLQYLPKCKHQVVLEILISENKFSKYYLLDISKIHFQNSGNSQEEHDQPHEVGSIKVAILRNKNILQKEIFRGKYLIFKNMQNFDIKI